MFHLNFLLDHVFTFMNAFAFITFDEYGMKLGRIPCLLVWDEWLCFIFLIVCSLVVLFVNFWRDGIETVGTQDGEGVSSSMDQLPYGPHHFPILSAYTWFSNLISQKKLVWERGLRLDPELDTRMVQEVQR